MILEEKICWCCLVPLGTYTSSGRKPFGRKNGKWDNICKQCRETSQDWLTPNKHKFLKKRFFSGSFILRKRCYMCSENYNNDSLNFPLYKFYGHISEDNCIKCCKENTLYIINRKKKDRELHLKIEGYKAKWEVERRSKLSPKQLLLENLKEDDKYTSSTTVKGAQAFHYLNNAGIEPTEELVELKCKQLKLIRYVRKTNKEESRVNS